MAGVKWIHKSGSVLPRRNSSTRWPSSPRKRGCSGWWRLAPSPRRWVSQPKPQQQSLCVALRHLHQLRRGKGTERMLCGKRPVASFTKEGLRTRHRQSCSCYCTHLNLSPHQFLIEVAIIISLLLNIVWLLLQLWSTTCTDTYIWGRYERLNFLKFALISLGEHLWLLFFRSV